MSDHLALENQLCFRLYRLNKRMTKMYAPLLKALQLTYPQYLVMLVLWQQKKIADNALSVKQLGEKLELDSGTLSPLLKRMEANTLIIRQRSVDDERTVHVHLSSHGASLEQKAQAIPVTLFQQTGLNNEEFEQLTQLLDKLISATA